MEYLGLSFLQWQEMSSSEQADFFFKRPYQQCNIQFEWEEELDDDTFFLKKTKETTLLIKKVDDLKCIQMLADIRSTTVLFLSIVFNDNFELPQSRKYSAIDFGSGTGILSLAAIISGIRKGARDISLLGIERSNMAVENSCKTLSSALERCRSSANITIEISDRDLKDPKTYEVIRRRMEESQFLVAELINHMTPNPFNTERDEIGEYEIDRMCTLMGTRGAVDIASFDPFTHVFYELEQHGILNLARQQRIAMFPNLFDGTYKTRIPIRTFGGSVDGKLVPFPSFSPEGIFLHQLGEHFFGSKKTIGDGRFFQERFPNPLGD